MQGWDSLVRIVVGGKVLAFPVAIAVAVGIGLSLSFTFAVWTKANGGSVTGIGSMAGVIASLAP